MICAGDQLVFVRTEIASPFELYSSDASMKDPQRDQLLQHRMDRGPAAEPA